MQQSTWVQVNQGKTGPRLFCLPYAGGGASIYRLWQQHLPEVVVCPIQLPGRENRLQEPAFTNVHELVPELIIALKPYLNEPFQIFGHSMGALISFELTRQLRREHLPLPDHLFVSAHRGPQIPHKSRKLHAMSDQEFKETLMTLGGTPEMVLRNEELMELFLPILRADFTLAETYQYVEEPPLPLPISAMGGQNDSDVELADIDEWRAQTDRSFDLQVFSGNHFYINSHQEELLRYLRSFYR